VPRRKYVDTRWIVHGVSTERWIARYDLEPFTHPCNSCGEPLTTTIPFIWGQFRGLMAPRCACGDPNPPYCFVRDPKLGDLFDYPGRYSKGKRPRVKPKSQKGKLIQLASFKR
jgi:hypothetical protein